MVRVSGVRLHSPVIPGPQVPGTGGTLGVVGKDRRDRGHPPIEASL